MSKHANSPVDTDAKTCLPSVLGDADAELPSLRMNRRSPVASLRFHNSLPSVLMHISTRSLSSALVRKMRSPQIAGVELPMPGSGNFQTIFSVALHFAGRPVSLEMPSFVGPRHCGQLS